MGEREGGRDIPSPVIVDDLWEHGAEVSTRTNEQ